MPPTVQDVFADPNFRDLAGPEKIKVMDRLDPNFAGLPLTEKSKVVMQLLAPHALETKGDPWAVRTAKKIVDFPGEGVVEAGRGLRDIGRAKSGREVAAGATRTLEGGLQAATPLIAASGVGAAGSGAALVESAVQAGVRLFTGGATQAFVEKSLRAMHLPEEYARLAADAAGLIVGTKLTKAEEVTPAARELAQKLGPRLRAAGKAAGKEATAVTTVKGFPVPRVALGAGVGAEVGHRIGGTPGAVIGGVAGAATKPIVAGAKAFREYKPPSRAGMLREPVWSGKGGPGPETPEPDISPIKPPDRFPARKIQRQIEAEPPEPNATRKAAAQARLQLHGKTGAAEPPEFQATPQTETPSGRSTTPKPKTKIERTPDEVRQAAAKAREDLATAPKPAEPKPVEPIKPDEEALRSQREARKAELQKRMPPPKQEEKTTGTKGADISEDDLKALQSGPHWKNLNVKLNAGFKDKFKAWKAQQNNGKGVSGRDLSVTDLARAYKEITGKEWDFNHPDRNK